MLKLKKWRMTMKSDAVFAIKLRTYLYPNANMWLVCRVGTLGWRKRLNAQLAEPAPEKIKYSL
jgi:hypothetical protein